MVKLFRKNSNLCDHNPPTSQTDRRMDGRTDDMRSQDGALQCRSSFFPPTHLTGPDKKTVQNRETAQHTFRCRTLIFRSLTFMCSETSWNRLSLFFFSCWADFIVCSCFSIVSSFSWSLRRNVSIYTTISRWKKSEKQKYGLLLSNIIDIGLSRDALAGALKMQDRNM